MKTMMAAFALAAIALPAVAQEGGFSEESLKVFQQMIVGKNMKCQDVKTVTPKGADARGDVVEVGCRVDGAGMTNRVYYRVTLAPNDDVYIEPVE